MKSLRSASALFLFLLVALLTLPSAEAMAQKAAMPKATVQKKRSTSDMKARDSKETKARAKVPFKSGLGQPNDSTNQGPKRSSRRSRTVEDINGNEWEAYSFILDGQEYYQKTEFDASYNPGYDFEVIIDGYEPVLQSVVVSQIPESQYSGMYGPFTNVHKPLAMNRGTSPVYNAGGSINDTNYDEDELPVGSYTWFPTLEEYLAYKHEEGYTSAANDTYYTGQYAWSQEYYNYLKALPNYQAVLNAESSNTMSFEDEFEVIDNSRPITNQGIMGSWRTAGCVPNFYMCRRDAGFVNEDNYVIKNLGVKTFIVPSKVIMLRWMEDESETDNSMTYTPNLQTITFQSTSNMCQIGGFKNYKHLQNCAIGTLTNLKVIEAECFSGCTSLNIDSVDLRGMWVGSEAFNGVRATHLDLDHTNVSLGQGAKLYNVKCPIIVMHHDASHRSPYSAASFLKQVNGSYVLDDDEESYVLVPCALYADYISAAGWSDIADQIIPYNETEEDPCGYYVIIDGVKTYKDVAYSKDDDNKSFTLISVGSKSGRVLEIPQGFADIFPGLADYTVQEIGSSVCCDRKDFKRVILPPTIKKIGQDAFRESSVEYVSEKGRPIDGNSFPRDIEEIGYAAFAESQLSGGLAFPNGLKKIDDHAFNQTLISSVYLPGSLTTNASDIDGMEGHVNFPNSKFAIGEWSFYGNVNLTSVYMDEGINGVGECAFQFNPELVSMHVPNSMRFIGGHFCCGAWKMQSLTIPSGVTDIDGSFLHGCESMRNVYLLGPPSMLTYEHIRSGCSFGPVDPIDDWDKVPDYECKHVNNCTFWVNNLDTYYSYINFINNDNEKPWLRLDRFDMAYNLYGSNNPEWAPMKYYIHHQNDFPVVDEVYENCKQHMAAGSRRIPALVEGRTTLTGAYLQTGYHNTYNYFDATPVQLPTPTNKDDNPSPNPKDKWSTICFPFKPVKSELDNLIGSDAIIAEYTGAHRSNPGSPEGEDCKYQLTFRTIDHGDIVPDKPYLIRPATGTTVSITMHSDEAIPLYNNVATPMTAAHWTVPIETTQTVDNESTTDVLMIGTYLEYKLLKAEFYLKNTWSNEDDAWAMTFYKAAADGKVKVNPHRCFFRITKNGVPIDNARIGTDFELDEEDGGITSVKHFNFLGSLGTSHSVYNLMGQKVAESTDDANLPTGIYIVDGRKVMINKR